MKRRSFLRQSSAAVALGAVAPMALLPDVDSVSKEIVWETVHVPMNEGVEELIDFMIKQLHRNPGGRPLYAITGSEEMFNSITDMAIEGAKSGCGIINCR